MRSYTRLLVVLTAIAVCLLSSAEILAGKGGGKGRGGGGGFKNSGSSVRGGGTPTKSFHGPQGGQRGGNVQTQRGAWDGAKGKAFDARGNKPFDASGNVAHRGPSTLTRPTSLVQSPTGPGGGGHWQQHADRELRKLDHRRQVADHLRNISEMNGNPQLQQVAQDMEQRALSHYDHQMSKIQDKFGLDEKAFSPDGPLNAAQTASSPLDPLTQFGQPVDQPLNQPPLNQPTNNSWGEKLTGRENALSRQLRNEERKLTQRMQAAENLRQLAQQTGDDSLFEAADRLDDWAMNHYDKRMSQITDFSERDGLTDRELLPVTP